MIVKAPVLQPALDSIIEAAAPVPRQVPRPERKMTYWITSEDYLYYYDESGQLCYISLNSEKFSSEGRPVSTELLLLIFQSQGYQYRQWTETRIVPPRQRSKKKKKRR